MRLTAKFLLAFVLALAIALGVTTWRNVARESALFDRDLRHDSLLVGGLVAQAYERAERLGDRSAAEAAVADARTVHTGFQVARLPVSALPPAVAASVAAGAAIAVRDDGAHPDGRIDTFVPLRSLQAGVPPMALRVTASLRAERRYVQATKRRALLTSLAALGLAAIAVSLLGVMLIARPTRALVAKARRVGKGDFGGALALAQRDELGALATELNTMSDHLAEARRHLEQESRARITAVEQLRHADRLMTVGKLAAGIAHELGTPLNVIEGRARMIQTGDIEGAEVADSARIVVEQARRITKIVRQLLDFARRGVADVRTTDLTVLAQRTEQLLAAAARTADLTLRGPASPTPVLAQCDESQIFQVLTNLVVNAIHATAPGGQVAIEVDAVDATPPHAGAVAGRYAVLRVTDTGRGMDAATRERIFEPFFTTKDVGEGTGLGLAVVHGIVHDHGGWVEVDSQPGEGSRFSVYLPGR